MALGVIYYSLNYCRGQQGEAVRAFVAKPEDSWSHITALEQTTPRQTSEGVSKEAF